MLRDDMRVCKQCDNVLPDSGRGVDTCKDCMPAMWTEKLDPPLRGARIVFTRYREVEVRDFINTCKHSTGPTVLSVNPPRIVIEGERCCCKGRTRETRNIRPTGRNFGMMQA